MVSLRGFLGGEEVGVLGGAQRQQSGRLSHDLGGSESLSPLVSPSSQSPQANAICVLMIILLLMDSFVPQILTEAVVLQALHKYDTEIVIGGLVISLLLGGTRGGDPSLMEETHLDVVLPAQGHKGPLRKGGTDSTLESLRKASWMRWH